jgi:hypothetical protein
MVEEVLLPALPSLPSSPPVLPVPEVPVLPVLPPLSSYPSYPWKKMVALLVYHDWAYNDIQFPADFNNDFAKTLAAICKVTVNTCCYLYATGINLMESIVEFFLTYEEASRFISGLTKKEGKELSIPLYHNPNYCNQEVTLWFHLVQQVWLKALQLYAVTHSFCVLPFNLPTLDEATILQFGLLVATINSGKTMKDMSETSIPVLPTLGNAGA